MPTEIEADIHEFRDWVFRYRPAHGVPDRVVVMLHGWTGNENSMWFFTRFIPEGVAIIAPRAPFSDPKGGYTWRRIDPGTWRYPTIEDLRPSLEALLGFINDWSLSENIDFRQLDLVGFSQGAALAYAITILNPGRVCSLTALSGFIPDGATILFKPHQLEGKPVFVAHGREDTLVPMEQARRAVKLLEMSGAKVRYCESTGGHKVSKLCLGEMKKCFEVNLIRSVT